MGALMAKRTSEFNVQARSTAPIVEGLEVLRVRARAAGVKSNGRKLSSEAMVNAILLAFLDLPREKQIEALTSYVPVFEGQFGDADADASPRAKALTEIIDDRPPESPRKRKGKPA